MDENFDKNQKKSVGTKMPVGTGNKIGISGDKKGPKKTLGIEVDQKVVGRKSAIVLDVSKNKNKDKDKGGKALEKDKVSKGKDKDKVKKGKKNPKWGKSGKISRSIRAGVNFPVSRLHRMLKPYTTGNMRVSGTSAIFLTAVVEYLAAEVLELAGNECQERHQKFIKPRHLTFAIKRDEELDQLIKATIRGGGVVPDRQGHSAAASQGKHQVDAAGTPGEF